MLCSQGVNKDSYLILETLPTEYDSRVKAMEVDERPTEQYSDIGGLDKQIQEVREAMPAFLLFHLIDQSVFPYCGKEKDNNQDKTKTGRCSKPGFQTDWRLPT